ncbi:hypothetical protein TW1_058 [Pseudoalteromonas phage TW1]|uniref:hypothetical protein n=1 Tax=Pseudoalteromonas phage TW1 TaxID=1366055 RepID=UPI00035AB356|nr:hypothetical protein PP585_gp58 [Pseudoalteromonas phage TW1]AGR46574.1 hypothetical protein TW1_058 [Pseudoalteromonas phage TW1]
MVAAMKVNVIRASIHIDGKVLEVGEQDLPTETAERLIKSGFAEKVVTEKKAATKK